jgi:hypothetical protein
MLLSFILIDSCETGVIGSMSNFMLLFALGCLFRLGHAADELDKSIAISFWRNGRDLGFCVRKAFDEVLHSLDN